MNFRHCALLILLFCSTLSGVAQTLSGFVQDENNAAVPYMNVYVKTTDWGAVTDSRGRYFIDVGPGEFEVVFSAIGYENKTVQITIGEKDVVKNVWVKESAVQLNELMIKAKRRDPAYEIIQNAIAHKGDFLKQFESSRCELYIKAAEVIDEKERKRRAKQKKMDEEAAAEGPTSDEEKKAEIDPFAEAKARTMKLLNRMNLVEVQMTRNYQYPNDIKEVKTAYEKYGDVGALFFTTTVQADFNFYHNLIDVPLLTETPLISPLNSTSVLSYKFKLEEAVYEDGRLVYKIEMTPRKQGNATWSGTLWIVDGLWNIKRLDLNLKKGNMAIYDDFRIRQEYILVQDSLWVLNAQEFDYISNTKKKKFTGHTLATYSDWEINPTFDKRFFRNELAVTTQEAYERDSTYWDKIRPQPLTKEEQRLMEVRDSIHEAHNKKEYLDSVDEVYNKVTFGKVTWFGVGHRVRAKKKEFYFGSLTDWWEPIEIGGTRLGPYSSYFKKWKNERWLYISGGVDVGVRNQDLKGGGDIWYRYDPMRSGQLTLEGGHEFSMINTFDAYLNMARRSNYIENTFGRINNEIELFNGMYLNTGVRLSDRKPLGDYEFGSLMDQVIEDNDPLVFDRYQSFITSISLAYTINQKYVTEPNRKVVLGSKWPRITLLYRKGWDGPLGSDIDFDQVELGVSQTFKIRTLGTSKYRVSTGKFFNTEGLRFVDYRFHRQSDPLLWSNPLFSFQNIDTTLPALDYFVEAHYIHHFNGAIINYVPFIKKTRIKTVGGGGALWDSKSGYRYVEAFVGLERAFKIQRQRFRIGIYGVGSESNFGPPKAQFKFSIEFFNSRDGKWNF
jgi:hypothetical protein